MSATASIVVKKSFSYRGATKIWSNRYHMDHAAPVDGTHWTTLSDAIVTAEKAVYPSTVTIVETIGYAAGSDVPIFSKTYSTAGTASASGYPVPGAVAALVRYSTAARTSKNHPVYLFNYYHGCYQDISARDQLDSSVRTHLQTYADDWVTTGFSDGTNTFKRAGPNGAAATGYEVQLNLTHRDFV